MARFTKFILLAQRLIQKNGRSITLTYPNPVDVNPAKPWLGKLPGVTTSVVKGVFLEYKRTDQRSSNDGVSLDIQIGDKRVLVAAGDVTPNDIKAAVKLTDRAQDWKIVHVSTLDPEDDPIMYDVQVRA